MNEDERAFLEAHGIPATSSVAGGAFRPIMPKAKGMTPKELERYLTRTGVPHVHKGDGTVVPGRNRAERRAAGARVKATEGRA